MTALFAWTSAVCVALCPVCGLMLRRASRINERAVVTFAESLCQAAAHDPYDIDAEESDRD